MMENKFSKQHELLNGHFGIMPKISPTAWKEVEQCAKKVRDAVNKFSEVAINFKAQKGSYNK
jgi:hypothetical protein